MTAVCQVCMHHCTLETGQRGICKARVNLDGVVRCENYGYVTALALDPIEKKPLRVFYPGSMILSVGSYGCNLRCPFCQNHPISMADWKSTDMVFLSPDALTEHALRYRNAGNIGVAFTYNEPLIGWEYLLDTARLVKAAGMKTVIVTNGSASLQVLETLLPYIDAMNIDLKGFREEYYQKLGGSLETVKDFIRLASSGCHVELTTLIVPGENDSEAEMQQETAWIAGLNRQIPLHITRFFPQYLMRDREPTDVRQIHHLAEIARHDLEYVFVGNC